MKKQIVTIVLGAVVMLGTATAVFAKLINDVAYGCDVFHVGCSASPHRVDPDSKAARSTVRI